MHRLALVISTAAAFAPAPRISRPLSRGGAPVPVATARAQPTMAVKLPGAEFDGCVAVQGSWLAVYYGYMWLSASLPSDCSKKQETWATRCFLNMHEQAPAFLAAFWTHAIFASPARAAQCGAVYIATRILYGIQRFHLKGGMTANAGLVSTVPGYVINLYLMTTAVARRCFGKVGFGASKWAPLAFFPVCVSLFLLSGVVNEKIKGQFEDENAKFRPLPPVPDTGC